MAEYDSIRPYLDSEFRDSIAVLLKDEEFISAVDSCLGTLRRWIVFRKAARCSNADELQKRLVLGIILRMLKSINSTLNMDFSRTDPVHQQYLFISNHRDIVLDPSLLDCCMAMIGGRGVEIAIGDNLLIRPWIKELVRLNKCFIVKRSIESASEFLEFSKLLSGYIHDTIGQGNDSVWIAQREGRAKDSNDLTQRSLVKMLSLSGSADVVDSLKELHIVPLSISYEYDPCDWLKAMEFQMKRDDPQYRKTQENDLLNMKTGIFGHKGRIHFQAYGCIDEELDAIDRSKPRNVQLDQAAAIIDHGIHCGYNICPCNHIALDMLQGCCGESAFYSAEEKREFEGYLEKQLSNITLENPDWDFLRGKMLEMYANPLINYKRARTMGQFNQVPQ